MVVECTLLINKKTKSKICKSDLQPSINVSNKLYEDFALIETGKRLVGFPAGEIRRYHAHRLRRRWRRKSSKRGVLSMNLPGWNPDKPLIKFSIIWNFLKIINDTFQLSSYYQKKYCSANLNWFYILFQWLLIKNFKANFNNYIRQISQDNFKYFLQFISNQHFFNYNSRPPHPSQNAKMYSSFQYNWN